MKKIVLGGALALLLAGCVTSGGVSDEVLIGQMLDTWQAGLVAHDVEAVMATFSEDFSHYEAPDKDTLADLLEQAFDMGMGDEMEISLANAETVIDGGEATVGPIDLSTVAGSITGNLLLTKEDGRWLITGVEVTAF